MHASAQVTSASRSNEGAPERHGGSRACTLRDLLAELDVGQMLLAAKVGPEDAQLRRFALAGDQLALHGGHRLGPGGPQQRLEGSDAGFESPSVLG
jgi:hypothetical protein